MKTNSEDENGQKEKKSKRVYLNFSFSSDSSFSSSSSESSDEEKRCKKRKLKKSKKRNNCTLITETISTIENKLDLFCCPECKGEDDGTAMIGNQML